LDPVKRRPRGGARSSEFGFRSGLMERGATRLKTEFRRPGTWAQFFFLE
jgi:hypothetical protein